MLTIAPQWLIGRGDLPANNLPELIAWLKANGDKASFGTIGIGSPSHVFATSISRRRPARAFNFVPYRGGGPAMQDLVAGQIDLSCLEASNTLRQRARRQDQGVRAAQQDALVRRRPTCRPPKRPACRFTMPFWHGLWVPAGTPKDILAKINAAVVDDPDRPGGAQAARRDRARKFHPRDQLTPAALGAFHKAEIDKWWPVIKAANIKAE